ncbi:MAG: exodeoxyribonuclease III [Candidatus Aegiribacteria sp.]|nr:exodeoxyribonuclease III [Candidatus Aegiribacteria sp.]MBD3295351.1 exodeoxyribonuclease III [Candidatus Fermentibacteria bacterium]
MKVATWNVNSIRAREDVVLRWMDLSSPDILCIQETKVQEELFPRNGFEKMGYTVSLNVQKTWNGVAVFSKNEPLKVSRGLPSGFLGDQKRLITVEFPNLTVVNVYVPNGGEVNLDKFQDKLKFLEELRDYTKNLSNGKPLVLLGDFNVAPEEEDVYDAELLNGRVCFHPKERKRLRDILSSGLTDVYRSFHPNGKAYSWWDYRAAAFRRKMGMRLDLVLVNGPALEKAVSCEIDPEPRGWKKPSDHTPVILELEL